MGDLPTHWHPQAPVTVDLPVPQVALAIGAHPDDVEFGCGATLAKWASAGCRLHHLVLTDGSKGTWDAAADRTALVAARRAEQRAAAGVLGGGEVTFLAWPDGELQADLSARSQVCAVIRRVRPDVVLGHDPWRRYRLHPDHRHAGWLTVDGVVAARDPQFFPELGLAPHRPERLLLWEADVANHVEDAAGFERVKTDALLAHRSQHGTTMGIASADEAATLEARIRRQLAAHGALAGLAAAEAFHCIADL